MTDADWDALTPRMREVATDIADGLTTKQIAAGRHLSTQRVQSITWSIVKRWALDYQLDVRVQITRRVLAITGTPLDTPSQTRPAA
jgi:DNA-binding NarL/FixJ family response regulator